MLIRPCKDRADRIKGSCFARRILVRSDWNESVLIVHPDFQNRGLGTSLMNALMVFIKANARSGVFIGLMAAQGLETFYERFGFKAREEDAPGMHLRIK